MLCLANSYKHGGRCLAGIELQEDASGGLTPIYNTDDSPIWIRPISHTSAGEVPNSDAIGISVMSVICIVNAQSAGLHAHSEDVYYSKLEKTSKRFHPTESHLEPCIDNYHINIFGNRGKAVKPEDFQKSNYSLMLIRAEGAEIYLDTRFEKPRQRLKFRFNRSYYDFPITDPEYLHRLTKDPSLYRIHHLLYLVLSLGVEYEGWHFKLVATIIEPVDEII